MPCIRPSFLPVCEELDKLNKNFLWKDTDRKKKFHLCQWSMVCRPKSKGGFGIKRACVMNQALLAKLGWRIHAKNSGLWSQIYQAKYLKVYSILDPKFMKEPSVLILGKKFCMELIFLKRA